MGFASAAVTFETSGGRSLQAPVPIAKGHPGNPMSWHDMRRKFDGLVPASLGNRGAELFGHPGRFGGGASLPAIRAILQELPQWT